MGVMRFLAHPSERLQNWPEVFRSYLSGFDGRVFPTRIEIDGAAVLCRRQSSESGKLHICWPVEGFGRPVVSTCSLPERERPYLLPLELARGKISQIRDQCGAWQVAGMLMPKDLQPLLSSAQKQLAHAVQLQDDPEACGAIAQEALGLAFKAAELLTLAYTRQRLEIYKRRAAQLPSLLGCQLGPWEPTDADSAPFLESFNAAFVPIEWKRIEPVEGQYHWDLNDAQVEWCQQNKLFMHAGPLLDLSENGLPDWLWKWHNDFHNLQSFLSDFVETAIARYFGRIRYWEVSAYGNTGGGLGLTEEQRITLVARMLEVARHVDDEIQLSIRIEQPWGGYQSSGQHRLSPLQFIDALLRSGVGLSTVNLEIAVGYAPRKSGYRDLLQISQLFDLWGGLGIPLQVTLAFPSSASHDPLARAGLEVDVSDPENLPGIEAQSRWVEQVVPLLMAKQPVVGIYWTHYSDSLPHLYPAGGLIDDRGEAKPALNVFEQCRRQFWNRG